MTRPLLALIYTGRNDRYMGNFMYRIRTCLNFVAHNVARLGRQGDVELRVADWGSDVPLSDALALSPEAATITRFHYIPAELCRRIRPDGDFSPGVAANVVLRRCPARFMMTTETDCLLPFCSLRALLEVLEGQVAIPFDRHSTMFFCMRRQLPWEIVQREPDIDFWERFVTLNAGNIDPDDHSAGLGGSGAGQMMTREMWAAHRGYSEKLVGQGWIDVDLALRVTRRHPVFDLGGINVCLYHMEHWPRNKRKARWTNKIVNPYHVSTRDTENGEDWGMDGETIAETKAAIAPAPVEPRPPETREVPLGSPIVARRLQQWTPRWRLSAARWELLAGLAWHASERFPRSYLELYAQEVFGAAVVGGACPATEVLAIDTWRDSRPLSTPAHLWAAMRRNGFHGYLRFVVTNPLTTFDAEANAPSEVDLLSLLWQADPRWTALLLKAAERLAVGGLLAVGFPDRPTRDTAWRPLLERFPGGTHIFGKTGRTAFYLATPCATGPRTIDFGRPRLPALGVIVKQIGHYVRRASENPRETWSVLKAAMGCRDGLSRGTPGRMGDP